MAGLRRIALWTLRASILVLALWVVFRLLGLESGYPLVAIVAFTPYVATIAVLMLAAAVVARRLSESLAALVVVILLALAVLPRVIPGQPTGPIEGGVPLDVLTINVYRGEADAAQVVDAARRKQVDLLSVQELTAPAVKRLRREGIDELLPHQELRPVEASGGAGLYSRYPIRPLPVVPGGISRMVRARVRVPGAVDVEVVAIHPYPPTERNAADWLEGLQALPRADPEGPLRILAGDFNATFDHDEFRDLVGSGYVDAAAARGLGLSPTWPVGRDFPPQVTIDHVLVDERAHVAGAAILDIADTDHRAVLANLVLPPREHE